jgi:hypothetical protein
MSRWTCTLRACSSQVADRLALYATSRKTRRRIDLRQTFWLRWTMYPLNRHRLLASCSSLSSWTTMLTWYLRAWGVGHCTCSTLTCRLIKLQSLCNRRIHSWLDFKVYTLTIRLWVLVATLPTSHPPSECLNHWCSCRVHHRQLSQTGMWTDP